VQQVNGAELGFGDAVEAAEVKPDADGAASFAAFREAVF
jgi:hypothetical protein